MSEQDTLSKFGINFQIKTLTVLLKNPKFLEQIYDLLSPKYYDSDANKWIIKVIHKYFSMYAIPPTPEIFKIEIAKDTLLSDVMRTAITQNLREVGKNYGATDLKYVEKNFMEFAKNQEMKIAILDSVELLKVGKYDDIRNCIDRALKAGSTRDLGVIYKEEKYFKRRISDTVRNVVETPWDVINDITDGGIGKGELGVMIGNSGVGKSWALVAIGAHAINKGFKILHYTMELSEDYIALRYDSKFSGFAPQNIRFHENEVRKKIDSLHGNLIVKYYPTKIPTIDTLRVHTAKVINSGFEPDMILIDYADLLTGYTKHQQNEKRFEIENIYENIRGFAGELDVPIWTVSQANRSSIQEEIVEADKISEAYKKIMIADFIFSLQRRRQDKIKSEGFADGIGRGRAHIIKNRFGPDGMTFPVKVNTTNGTLQLFVDNSPTGKQLNNDLKKGEILDKKAIQEKIDEWSKKDNL